MKKDTKKQILNISFVVLMAVITIGALLGSSKELNYTNLRQFFSICNFSYFVLDMNL